MSLLGTVKDQRISSITITTLEEQQHLVLKVIQPPKRSAQIAAIPLRDSRRMEAEEFALIKTINSSKMPKGD